MVADAHHDYQAHLLAQRGLQPWPPTSISSPVQLNLTAPGGYLARVSPRAERRPAYRDHPGPRRRDEGWRHPGAAPRGGTQYPAEVAALYGRDTLPPDALGPESRALPNGSSTPRSPRTCTTSPCTSAPRCANRISSSTTPTCRTSRSTSRSSSASSRRARILVRHYASTMTVFLRELGIPARYVQGFSPASQIRSAPDARSGRRDAHAWVQAYFPGYGWVDFDPTGGPVDELRSHADPSGAPLASGSPTGRVPSRCSSRNGPTPTRSTETELPATRTQGGPPVGLFIGIAILLAVSRRAGPSPLSRGAAQCTARSRRTTCTARRRDSPAGSGSARVRRRPSTSTPGPSAMSCPWSVPSPDRRTGQGRGRLWRPDAGR